MTTEEPFIRKCCFCIPLQSCLQIWAGVKAVADISAVVILTLITLILTGYSHGLKFKEFGLEHAFIILIFVLVFDFVFMVVLSVGLCKKDLRSLRVFFYYSFYMLFLGIFLTGAAAIYVFNNLMPNDSQVIGPALIGCGFLNAILDSCIIVTLKSEMIKLRNKQQFGFVVLPVYRAEVNETGPVSEN